MRTWLKLGISLTIRIAARIIEPPYLYSCAIYNVTNCPLPGVHIEILKTISAILKFTFEVIEVSNATSHEDLIQELGSGGVFNISATMVTINSNAFDFVQFSHSMMYYRKSFAIRTPRKKKMAFLLPLPFAPLVWICFFVSIPLISLVFTVAAHLENDSKKRRFSRNLWTVIGSLVKPTNSRRLTTLILPTVYDVHMATMQNRHVEPIRSEFDHDSCPIRPPTDAF